MTASQARRDLGIAANIVSRWVREAGVDKKQTFPGRGQMKADDAEVARLRRELARTKAERDIGSSPLNALTLERQRKSQSQLKALSSNWPPSRAIPRTGEED